MKKTIVAMLGGLAMGMFSLGAQAKQDGPQGPSKAPAFTLSSQEGKPVSLSDYLGKWVVLYFYPKDFTSGCTLEARSFQKELKRFEALGAVILGVSMQNAESHKEFCTKEGLSFKLLADTEGTVSKAYGSVMNLLVAKVSARHTFIIDPEGYMAKSYFKVSPSKHTQEVLSDLAALQAQRASKLRVP